MSTIKEAIKRVKEAAPGHVAVAIWQREDVLEMGRRLGVVVPTRVADDILDYVDDEQQADQGITWDVLECHVQDYMRDHPRYKRYRGPGYEGDD